MPITPLPGDFGVLGTHPRSPWPAFVAWTIRKLTHSDRNHAITYLGDGLIGEADPAGYRIRALTEYDPKSILWSSHAVPLNSAQRRVIVQSARAYAAARNGHGVPYNFLDIVALAISLSTRIRTPAWVERRLSSHSTVMCSQAVVIFDAAAGVVLFPGVPSGRITPADLARLIIERMAKQ